MGVHNLASKAEYTAALKDHKIVVLDCWATWCGPCKAIAPQVDKFSTLYPTLYFTKLDVDEFPDVAAELSIRNIPTFIIFKDGIKWKEVVSANVRALKEAIEVAVEVEKSENGEKGGRQEEGEGEGGLVLDEDF